MFLNNLVNYIAAHEASLLLASMLLILVLLILVIYTMVRLSTMSSRYREMMRGSETEDIEGMLLQHIHAHPRGERTHPPVHPQVSRTHRDGAFPRIRGHGR